MFCFLLMQLPKGREVEDEDTFVFNDDFVAPLFRIKVFCACHFFILKSRLYHFRTFTDSMPCIISGQRNTIEGNC